MTVYNFAAGPSQMFKEVLEQAANEMLDYNGTGMGVVEMSHRSKPFQAIQDEAEALFRELLNIPENYSVLFMTGGGSTQFDAVPLNLLVKGKADYLDTGNFANKAMKAAMRYGDIRCVASSKADVYTYIPKVTRADFDPDADYVHITSNNTIFGTRFKEFPDTPTPLVCDMSSEILSRRIDVSKFGVIYAGAQKNISGAGVTVVIIRNDLIGNAKPICPIMLNYKTYADNGSMYNTPPCYSIYLAMLTLRHLKKLGGVDAINVINERKAKKLYDFIDNTNFYTNKVNKEDRSIMNVPFVCATPELDAKFVKEAGENGLVSIKGHRLVGGMRASIYNAMPEEGVDALIDFMKKFELQNS